VTRLAEETVLVVDDDEGVRALIADELRRRGYRVLDTASGDRAVETFSRSGAQIDLVLAELVLHDGSGPELVKRFRQDKPAIRVLFMSGLPQSSGPDMGHVDRTPFIQKPFSLQALIDKLRKVLDAPARAV
jgi:DNA-binding NtrC family response regulator